MATVHKLLKFSQTTMTPHPPLPFKQKKEKLFFSLLDLILTLIISGKAFSQRVGNNENQPSEGE